MSLHVGMKNDRLTLIGFTETKAGTRAIVRCICGKEKRIVPRQFRRTRSCGCLRVENAGGPRNERLDAPLSQCEVWRRHMDPAYYDGLRIDRASPIGSLGL